MVTFPFLLFIVKSLGNPNHSTVIDLETIRIGFQAYKQRNARLLELIIKQVHLLKKLVKNSQ